MPQHIDNTAINGIMLGLLVALFCFAVFTRMQPYAMRRLADYLNARADAEDWFKRRHGEYKVLREEKEREQEQVREELQVTKSLMRGTS